MAFLLRQAVGRYTAMDDTHGPDADVRGLLQDWGRGDIEARDQLFTVVYRELRRRAAASLRPVKQERIAWQNRGQFYGIAAQMRRVVVDRARARMGVVIISEDGEDPLEMLLIQDHQPVKAL